MSYRLTKPGQFEAAKWIAFVSMVVDHIGRISGTYSTDEYIFGRVAAPLFALVLTDGILASVDCAEEVCGRVLWRLLAAAVVTQPVFVWCFRGAAWSPNVFYSLALATIALEAGITGRFTAKTLLVLTSPFAMFGPGIALLPLAALLYRRDVRLGLLAGVVCLWFMNPNVPGLIGGILAFAIYYLLTGIRIRIPRIKHLFYIAYPAHMAMIKIACTSLHGSGLQAVAARL